MGARARAEKEEVEIARLREKQVEVAQPFSFSGEVGQITGFVKVCKLYKNENKRREDRGISIVGIDLYTEEISRGVE